jgi:hypothetical protein
MTDKPNSILMTQAVVRAPPEQESAVLRQAGQDVRAGHGGRLVHVMPPMPCWTISRRRTPFQMVGATPTATQAKAGGHGLPGDSAAPADNDITGPK